MSKRPSLRSVMPAPVPDEAVTAAAQVRQLERRREVGAEAADVPMTTSTIHLPVDLLNDLRAAAIRRAGRKAIADPNGRGGRPSVSEIVVELLEEQRERIRGMD